MLVFCLLDMHARVNVQTQQNSRREKKETPETPQKIHSGTLRACALREVALIEQFDRFILAVALLGQPKGL